MNIIIYSEDPKVKPIELHVIIDYWPWPYNENGPYYIKNGI